MLATFFATFRCLGRNRNFRKFLHFRELHVLRNFSATLVQLAPWHGV